MTIWNKSGNEVNVDIEVLYSALCDAVAKEILVNEFKRYNDKYGLSSGPLTIGSKGVLYTSYK